MMDDDDIYESVVIFLNFNEKILLQLCVCYLFSSYVWARSGGLFLLLLPLKPSSSLVSSLVSSGRGGAKRLPLAAVLSSIQLLVSF
jgi:hypothetical protein